MPPIAKAGGLAEASLKALRHTHASIALANGVPLPVVSKRLGHSNYSTTASIYIHALPNYEIAAADAWQKLKQEAATGLDEAKKDEILVAPFGTAAPTKKAVTNWALPLLSAL
ncbi:MAG: tyrosine-type recombinase/integrase [Acidobacteriota bacterium]|jgi:hypothetical protein